MFGVLPVLTAALSVAGIVSADGLNTRAQARGRYWGTAINPGVMADSRAGPILRNPEDFGSYTAENEMKFDALERSQGSFSYGTADSIVAQAKSIGAKMRCHNLVWYRQVPGWVQNGAFNKSQLISIMEAHIQNVVTHFKGFFPLSFSLPFLRKGH